MFKRIILGLVLVSTFVLGSLVTPQSADAWHYWGRPYRTYYSGPAYYGRSSYYGQPYPTYYRSSYYGPRYYSDPYYSGYYYDRPRVYVGFGNGGVIVR